MPTFASRSQFNASWTYNGEAVKQMRQRISTLKLSSIDKASKERQIAILQLQIDQINHLERSADIKSEIKRIRNKSSYEAKSRILEVLLAYQKARLECTWMNQQLLLLRLFGPLDQEPIFIRVMWIAFHLHANSGYIFLDWFIRVRMWFKRWELSWAETK
jgi:Fe2+ transport system protein B